MKLYVQTGTAFAASADDSFIEDTPCKVMFRPRMAVAPHHLASQSALAVLREGGSAIEAMVAAAATIAVVYPHMNGLGGDGFWLIVPPEGDPIAIDASGAAGSLATPQAYAGLAHIPTAAAGGADRRRHRQRLGRSAEGFAELTGKRCRWRACWPMPSAMPQTAPGHRLAGQRHRQQIRELRDQPGFAETWLVDGQPPQPGAAFASPRWPHPAPLAKTVSTAFIAGRWRSVWRGHGTLGLPVTLGDLQHRARPAPLKLQHQQGELWNLAPPTQGLVSLAILGITDRLAMADADDAMTVHRIVEATKLAFGLRDAHITDPAIWMWISRACWHPRRCSRWPTASTTAGRPWGAGKGPGDTVWMGVMDNSGLAVSFIKAFITSSAAAWCCRTPGSSGKTAGHRSASTRASAGAGARQTAVPPSTPPPRLNDGRVMVYGSMGGDGQPQTRPRFSPATSCRACRCRRASPARAGCWAAPGANLRLTEAGRTLQRR
jgi:gamma-glutamyltranspeptidase/glutathione hydrolase